MSPDKIVYMANQIARFFDSQRGGDPTEKVAQHLRDFWDPRMRAQLMDIVGGWRGPVRHRPPRRRKPARDGLKATRPAPKSGPGRCPGRSPPPRAGRR
ncbi:MAG: formate dehydrogenase subunit delta [Rhodobacteraceae bacterium]|nr:formate dehydrogenase subunit delta [Paracoccaceae bacterium]